MITLHVFFDGQYHEFNISDGEHTLGRAECDLIIPKPEISKRHADLRVDGARLFIRDLGSTNGTYVGGVPVSGEEHEVPPGVTLYFAGVEAWIAETREVSTSRARLTPAAHLRTHGSYHPVEGFTTSAQKRIADILSELLDLVSPRRDREQVEVSICEFLSRCLHVDRAVLLEDRGAGTPLDQRACWTRKPEPGDQLRLSTKVINDVYHQQRSVLIEDARSDPSSSMVDLRLRSAIAAPLFDQQRVRGILYADSSDPESRYTADDLQVLTITANAAAIGLRIRSLEKGLEFARILQQKMLPTQLCSHPNYEIGAFQEMSSTVGGDFYHCQVRPNGSHLVAVGDVAGKGLSAALAMANSMGLLRLLAEIGGTVEDLANQMHRQLKPVLPVEQFLTLFLGELSPDTGHLDYVNHGQERPILVRANGMIEMLEGTGLPVALLDPFEANAAETHLGPGDLLAVFSDGLPDATIDGSAFLGIDPVIRILREYRAQPLETIMRHIRREVGAFLEGSSVPDDITLLLLRRKA